MRKVQLMIWFVVLFSLDMARCQTKDYKEKLESLYNHSVPLITTNEFSAEQKREKSMVLLDIRSPEEFAISRIKGARLIDYDHFKKENVLDIPLDSEVVVYCSVGYRSEKVGEQLLELGYKNVKNLYGGIFQWKNDGFEVVNASAMPTDSVHTYNKSWSIWLLNGVKVY